MKPYLLLIGFALILIALSRPVQYAMGEVRCMRFAEKLSNELEDGYEYNGKCNGSDYTIQNGNTIVIYR